jgi:hypothetical protein
MSDAKASASGPLWAKHLDDGSICMPFAPVQHGSYVVPCRIIPGHGRWVPADLVAAIEKAHCEDTDYHTEAACATCAAIRAAKGGEV